MKEVKLDLVLDKVYSSTVNVFRTKPLSITQLVQNSGLYSYCYDHIWDQFLNFQENHKKHYYISGPIGSGKATLYNTLFIYKLYLYTCLENPFVYFGHTQCEHYFGVVGTSKDFKFIINSLVDAFNLFPMFVAKSSAKMKPDKIYYSVGADRSTLFTIEWLCNNEVRQINIELITDKFDLVTKNPISVLCPGCMELLDKISESDLFNLMTKIQQRIDARTSNEYLISGLIVEKAPYDLELSEIDKFIYKVVPRKDDSGHMQLPPYWTYFPGQNSDVFDYFDLETEQFITHETDNTIKVPLNIRQSYPTVNKQQFLRDVIGLPSSTVPNPAMIKIQKVIKELTNGHLVIVLEQGIFYLKDPASGIKCDISKFIG